MREGVDVVKRVMEVVGVVVASAVVARVERAMEVADGEWAVA